jgi:hypothetical protein
LLGQLRRVRILCRIEQLMRVGIAGQEALQAHHVRTAFGTNQHRTAGASLDEGDAAQDQRLYDSFAQFGLYDHQGAQVLRRNRQRVHIVGSVNIDERRLA